MDPESQSQGVGSHVNAASNLGLTSRLGELGAAGLGDGNRKLGGSMAGIPWGEIASILGVVPCPPPQGGVEKTESRFKSPIKVDS